MDALSFLINNVFYLSLIMIIITSLVGIFVKTRARDRCLKDFEDFNITVELAGKKFIWGKLKVFGSGIELEYQDATKDQDGHFEKSYIIYNNEFDKVHAVYRYHHHLSDENKRRRQAEIRKTYKPDLWHVAARKTRNFFNTFRDGLSQIIKLIIGNIATAKPKSIISQKQKDLTGIGTQVIGTIEKAYDPILEKYIGQYVVLESYQGDKKVEMSGILKEYTNKFLEILNVIRFEKLEITPSAQQKKNTLADKIEIAENEAGLFIRNSYNVPIFFEKFSDGTTFRDVKKPIPAQDSFSLSDISCSRNCTFVFTVPFQVDLLAPRPNFVVRHGSLIPKKQLESILKYSDADSKTIQDWEKALLPGESS